MNAVVSLMQVGEIGAIQSAPVYNVGYRSIITFIFHSPFSIFDYLLIFCSVYLSEQLCYTIY